MLTTLLTDVEVVEVLESVEESVEYFSGEVDADVVFMDIHLADGDSFRIFQSVDINIPIIFTTAYAEFAVEGFRLDAVDYILKPFSYEEFARAVGKARSLFELLRMREAHNSPEAELADDVAEDKTDRHDYISIKVDYKVRMVRYADIIYVESVGEYVRLHLNDGTKVVTLFRLKNMESALPSTMFMRVHRSYIINMNRVSAYSRGKIFLDNGDDVPLSINYREVFRAYLESRQTQTALP
jgi:two-component system LytT family response regulator